MMGHLLAAARTALENSRSGENLGLVGATGDALFACASAVFSRVTEDACIQRAIEHLETRGGEVSLHHGIAGLALVIAMFRGIEAEDVLTSLDEIIAGSLARLPPASLQSGVAGVALYASLRTHRESGRHLQGVVVENLRSAATQEGRGLVWYTPVEYARERGVAVLGEPILEYGMVHGVAGTLVALSSLARRGDIIARDLLRGGLEGAWEHASRGQNRFGRTVFGPRGALGAQEYSVPSWCVGDPGVLRALWVAAQALGDRSSADRALEALLSEAQIEANSGSDRLNGRIDMCCGSAGVAQIYDRMYRETRTQVFREASDRLLERCLSGVERLTTANLPYGRMGILLALLSAQRAEEPIWDAVFGVSIPSTLR